MFAALTEKLKPLPAPIKTSNLDITRIYRNGNGFNFSVSAANVNFFKFYKFKYTHSDLNKSLMPPMLPIRLVASYGR